MLSYAGIDLLEPSPNLREWARKNIDPADLWQFSTRHWPGRNLTHIPFRPPGPPSRVELNVLHWPTSASRFAVGWYIVDQALLDLIRAEVYVGGGTVPADLVIGDGTDSLTAEMWMLPATPLQQIGADGLYLLTLVDERYYHWYRAAAVTVSEGSTTWAQLYTAIAAGLDISLSLDAVHADYLEPPESAGAQYEALPLLLDAVAYATGRRIVRQLDGTTRAWSATNSLAQQITSLAAVEDKLAGGALALSTSGEDNSANVPESVAVTFPRTDSGVPADTRHAEEVTLASLALAEYSGFTGFTGSKVYHASLIAAYPGPSNAAEITALSERIATDFYLWQAARTSLSIVGYPGWTLTGLDDALELRHESGRIYTRVLRSPFDDDVEELFYLGSEGSTVPPDPGDFALTVMREDGDETVLNVDTVVFKTADFTVTETAPRQAYIALNCKTVRRISGPPPWVAPDDVCCDELFYDGFYEGIYNCDTGLFTYYCPCEPIPPGSIPVGGCIAGACAECDEPPYTFEIVAAGFTGDCEVFNATWELINVDECIWKAADYVSGVSVVVTLTLAGGGNTLLFEGYDANGLLVSSSYTNAAADLPDCCVALTFDEDTCGCDLADSPSACSECGTTANVWELTGAGFGGLYSRFNGTFLLTWTGEGERGCQWSFANAEDDLRFAWFVSASGGSLQMIDLLTLPTYTTAIYTVGVIADCCDPQTLTLSESQSPSRGSVPGTLTITPRCEGDGGAGSCPDTLTATPTCCEDEPPDEPTCGCDQCPDGMPTRWGFLLDLASGAFAAARGQWFLDYVSDCEWTKTQHGITSTLDYNAGLSLWELVITDGITTHTLRNVSRFLCCGDNQFLMREASGPYGNQSFISKDITIVPDGPCTPCGGDGTDTPCCPDMPDELDFTFANGTGTCAAVLNGVSGTLTKDPVFDFWEGPYESSPGVTNTLRLLCNPTGSPAGWFITNFATDPGSCGWGASPGVASTSSDCAGHEVIFPVLGEGTCCIGTAELAVTW